LGLAFFNRDLRGGWIIHNHEIISENEKAMKKEELEKDIRAVLERQVRPVLKAHDGDVELTGIEDGGVVHLRILGTCATCVGAEQTVKEVIVANIRESCPWVSDVRVNPGVSDDLLREALRFLKRPRG
jgi:Fe-S cluster biogenesis protein NfuA